MLNRGRYPIVTDSPETSVSISDIGENINNLAKNFGGKSEKLLHTSQWER